MAEVPRMNNRLCVARPRSLLLYSLTSNHAFPGRRKRQISLLADGESFRVSYRIDFSCFYMYQPPSGKGRISLVRKKQRQGFIRRFPSAICSPIVACCHIIFVLTGIALFLKARSPPCPPPPRPRHPLPRSAITARCFYFDPAQATRVRR